MKLKFRIVDFECRVIDCGDFCFRLYTNAVDVICHDCSHMSGMSQVKVCNLKRVCRGFGRKPSGHIMVQYYYKADFERIVNRILF